MTLLTVSLPPTIDCISSCIQETVAITCRHDGPANIAMPDPSQLPMHFWAGLRIEDKVHTATSRLNNKPGELRKIKRQHPEDTIHTGTITRPSQLDADDIIKSHYQGCVGCIDHSIDLQL